MKDLFENTNIDFLHSNNIKHYKTNSIIFNEKDECTGLSYIINGEVRISTFTYTYNEYSITTLYKNDLFGSSLLFSDRPFFLGDVICTKDTDILFIPKNKVLEWMKENNAFLNNYLNIISNKAMQAQNKVKVLSQKSIRDKILFFIKENNKNNCLKIRSKEDFARYLNIPRPSLSRELIKMNNEGLINMKRNIIHIKI